MGELRGVLGLGVALQCCVLMMGLRVGERGEGWLSRVADGRSVADLVTITKLPRQRLQLCTETVSLRSC